MRTVNSLIGSAIERLEDLRFLRGRGQYVDDLARKDMLHAAFLRSSVAHGRIRSIDDSAARALPGVHSVITAKDIGNRVPRVPMRLQPLPDFEPFGQPVIAEHKVRYVGEVLALVLADTAGIAEDALGLIEVDIDPLPAVADRRSSAQNASLLFEDKGTNLAIKFHAVRGDAAAAFKDAPYVRRESFRTQRHMALPMEPRGLLAEWDAARGRLTVSGGAKVLFFNRRTLAKEMGLPESAIEIVENDVGGGFGARGEFYPEDFLIPFAARHTGRPVKWTEDRRENLMCLNHAREAECDVEIACTREGTILGLRGHAYVDVGAYMRTNGAVGARNIAQFMSGPYRIANIDIDVALQLTNKTPVGTYRGPGRFETDFFRERFLDMVAQDLGLDRVEFRRRNLVRLQEMPYSIATITPFESKDEFDSGDYQVTLDRCLDEIQWAEKSKLAGKLIDGRYHGVAIGCFIEGGAAGPKESARMVLEPDGLYSVYVGSSAIGQGLETAFAQIAADALEVPMDRIRGVFHGTTSFVSDGYGAYHSRSVVMGGSAMLAAAANLRDMIRAQAAERLGCAPAEIEIVEGTKAVGPGGKIGSVARAFDRRHLGRGRLSQQEAHLHLRRPCRARGGRSQARSRGAHRLCHRRRLRPHHQSIDGAWPGCRLGGAGAGRCHDGASRLRPTGPAADRLARRLSHSDRQRLPEHPRHRAGKSSLTDQPAWCQGRRRGRHHRRRRRHGQCGRQCAEHVRGAATRASAHAHAHLGAGAGKQAARGGVSYRHRACPGRELAATGPWHRAKRGDVRPTLAQQRIAKRNIVNTCRGLLGPGSSLAYARSSGTREVTQPPLSLH